MAPERLRQIVPLLESALELDLSNRDAYLDDACGGDEELRQDVKAVIAAYQSADKIFERQAVETILKVLAESPSPLPPEGSAKIAEAETARANADGDHSIQSQSIRQSSLIPSGVVIDGRYQIECELGHGGIGSVMLARDRKLYDTLVVIKVLRRYDKGDESPWYEKKFRQEAKALSKINHPGIVRVQDVGDLPDGRPYLVMQYVPGKPLSAAIPNHGMELERAGMLIHQISAALTAAHEQGVIHRDLKPDNIMLQTDGKEEHVKLIDFGIATVRERAGSAITEQTEAAGTRAYMAPEQLLGKPSIASDIYALGVNAYEMVTGRRPFNPDSAFQLLDLQRAGVKVKPVDLRESLPKAAQDVILKALSYNPEDRYSTAREFGEAFNRALKDKGFSSTTPTSRFSKLSLSTKANYFPRARPIQIWLSFAALLIAISIGTFIWWQNNKPGTERTARIALPKREIIYWLTVRRNPKLDRGSQIKRVAHSIIFDKGDLVRLHISSPQAGYLYVINEGPMPANGQPSYVMVFPYSLGNNFSAELQPNQPLQIPLPSNYPETDWLELDLEVGVEKIWLVWSERLIAELESVKHYADFTHLGEIKDPNQINSVSQYLSKHSANKPEIEEDETNKRIKLKSTSDMLVGLVKLEHQ